MLFLFIVLPILSFVYFLASLVVFIADKCRNGKTPGRVPPESLRSHKIHLIVSSVLFGLFVAGFIGLSIVLTQAIVNM